MKKRFALALSVLLLAGLPAAAQDDTTTQIAKNRVAFFDENASKAKDPMKYGELVMELAAVPHKLTVERVARILARDPDEDHKLIAAGALAEFTKPDDIRDLAGKHLVKAIEENHSIEVTEFVIQSVGKLKYPGGVLPVCDVLKKGGDPWVLVEGVRTLGVLGDLRALPTLLELWERHPVGFSWEGGEVFVDTGAAGNEDAEAAKAQYEKEHGGKRRRGKPPMMLRAYIQELGVAIKKITKDETITKPPMLRAWMEARVEEFKKLGIEIPKKKGPSKEPTKKDKDKDGKGKDEKGKDENGKDGAPAGDASGDKGDDKDGDGKK